MKRKAKKSTSQNPLDFKNFGAFFRGISKRLPTMPSIKIDEKYTSDFDRKLHSITGAVFYISPGSMATSYFDWLVHLSLSPGKQIELFQSAVQKTADLSKYVSCLPAGDVAECCIVPLPQDRRFSHESWKKWPYNYYQQSFLLAEKWWSEATSEVRGVTQHHSDVLPFMTRQVTDIYSPVNFPWMNPVVVQTTINQKGINFVKGTENFREDMVRAIKKEPPVGCEQFSVGQNLAITPGKVVYQNRLIELIQYSPTTDTVYSEPIFIVPAWIMKYYILDLSPSNSLVKYLVEKGHTVFMISWKNPDSKDRDLGFEDYLKLGIMEGIDAVSAIVPGQKIHSVGYCLGGTLLTVAAAAMAQQNDHRLQTITLFAAQVDFEEAGELLLFIDESQLTFLEDVMWDKGYLDASRMAGTFSMLRSYDLVWSRIIENYMLGERHPLNDLMAWNADTTRMPYRMHSEYLRSLFLNNDLTNGRFRVAGKTISLKNIAVPIFAVSTQRDHVAPWPSVYKIHFFTETEVTFVLTSGGHNAGIVSEPGHEGRSYQLSIHKIPNQHISHEEWQRNTPQREGSWWVAWAKWLATYSGDRTKPPAMGNREIGYRPLRNAPGMYVLKK